MVDFERAPNILGRVFTVDLSERPPTTARKSFAAFKTVVEQYPRSDYAHDRPQAHDLSAQSAGRTTRCASRGITCERGAYVAAAAARQGRIEQYDGAPAMPEALAVLMKSYEANWGCNGTGREQSRTGLPGQLPGRRRPTRQQVQELAK